MIQTLNSRTRSMLIDANLPITFWAEAINTAVYLHHRSPSSALEGNSPLEALQPARPIPLAHLHRFGCVAYHRIPDETRSASLIKFTPRSRLCMMVGYSESTKIWRLWDFLGNGGRGRPIYSSDIVFVEQENAISWQPDYEQPSQTESLSPIYFAPIQPRTNELPVTPQTEIDLFLKAPLPEQDDVESSTPLESLSRSPGSPPLEQGGWLGYFRTCSLSLHKDMCLPFSLSLSGCMSLSASHGEKTVLSGFLELYLYIRKSAFSLSGWVLRPLIGSKANHSSLSLSLDGCYNCSYSG